MKALSQAFRLAQKDLNVFVHDRGALFFSLVFPLIFVLGFSLVSVTGGSSDPLAEIVVAVEEGAGEISQQIVTGLEQAPSPSVRQLVPADARAQLDAGDLDGYILFPEGFSDAVARGGPATIHVVTAGGDINQHALLEGVASSIAADLNHQMIAGQVTTQLLGEAGTAIEPDQLRGALASVSAAAPDIVPIQTEQVGEVQPAEPGDLLLSGYLTMFVFFSAGFAGEELIRERENFTLDRLLASGVGGPTILAGKWFGAIVRAVVQAVVLWLAGVLFFDVDVGRDPLGVALVTLGMITASASFALLIAAIAKTTRSADSMVVVVSLVMAALGGSWWPLFIMPEWLQGLARITPHAWANDAFNRLLLFGADTGDILLNVAVLIAFGVVLGVAGVLRVRVRA